MDSGQLIQFIQAFKNPGATYYPCVMWFWNDRIDKEGIAFQLGEFQKSKINEFFIHPLWGLELKYQSPEFFALVRFAVKKAAEYGMKFWIYDEYNWPSGTAGGLMLEEKPETLGCVLMTKKITLYAGQPLDHRIEGEFVAAAATHKNKSAKLENITGRVNLSASGGQTRVCCDIGSCSTALVTLAYVAPSAGVCASGMWSSFSRYAPGWLDANDKESVDAFIDFTHERYKAEIGDEFGKTVLGVFNDEANNFSMFDEMHYSAPGGHFPARPYPWSKSFAGEFARDHGYDFAPYAYAADCSFLDADSVKRRYDYWNTLSRIFAKNYVKNIADWCQSNKLKLTGHLSYEESVYGHAYQMGDSYLALREFHIPGIDSLFSKNHVGSPEFTLTAKFAVTAAKLAGRERVICETFSGSGWDMTLQEMKRCLQRLVAAGVNMTQYMGAYYSLDHGRKRLPLTYPPSHGGSNPLFSHYGQLGHYVARLNAACADTVSAADIFVLLPLVSVQIDHNLRGILDIRWRSVCLALIGGHYEYDIASERALGDAEVEGGRLKINGFGYGTLVVPDMYYTGQKTIDIIDAFLAQGGRAVFCGNTKITICETGNTADYSDQIQIKADPENFDLDEFSKRLASALPAKSLDIGENRENIYVSHRKTRDGGDLYMIVNDNAKEVNINARFSHEGRHMYLLDPLDGGIHATDGAKLNIGAYSCVLVLCSKVKIEAENAENAENMETLDLPVKEKIALDGEWRFEPEGGNWFVLPVKMQTESQELLKLYDLGKNGEFLARSAKEYHKLGHMAASEFAGGYGIRPGDRYTACAVFEICDAPEHAELIIEYEPGMAVVLNGTDITGDLRPLKLWGIRTEGTSVAPLLKQGENCLVYIASIPEWNGPHGLPCAYLRGDFAVSEAMELTKAAKTIAPDIWTTQGYPHFSGTGCYETEFSLTDDFEKISIEIPTDDVVKIILNGHEVTTLLWRPYTADITGFAHTGKNHLRLEFTSTYKSLMQTDEYDLEAQGYLVNKGKAAPVRSGLLDAPTIYVY